MSHSIQDGRIVRAVCISLFLLGAITWAGPAGAAAENLVLKEQIHVQGDVVTLGDLFENPGIVHSIAVFRSPDLGTQGYVAARRVQQAASRHGAVWTNPGEIDQVMVHRLAREIPLEEITGALRQELGRVMNADADATIELRLTGTPKPLLVDVRTTAPIAVRNIHYEARSNSFDAVVGFDNVGEEHGVHRFRGQVFETVATVVPRRPIERGQTIAAADLRLLRVHKAKLRAGSVSRMTDIVGMAAKRRLTAGRQVRKTDIEPPRLVRRNGVVTIVYRMRGLMLQSQGRALEGGAKGSVISVRNSRSNQTLQAEVQDADTVVVAASGSRFASRRARTNHRRRTTAGNHTAR